MTIEADHISGLSNSAKATLTLYRLGASFLAVGTVRIQERATKPDALGTKRESLDLR
jgi:hypothetical protein